MYESLRKTFYPVTRDVIRIIFKNEIECNTCACAQIKDLPKTVLQKRKTIPATYPNSRWQIDLKKMPAANGYNYICSGVDCYSRFAFGSPTKGKTAKEIADIMMKWIYVYGPPGILQSDNGLEFNN